MMRVAIGPFDPNDPGSDWPVVGCEPLAPAFEIVPFGPKNCVDVPRDSDVAIYWSPEYAGNLAPWTRGYKVAVVGDHHIVPFEAMPWLANYDLIATDLRGVKRLKELGYPAGKLIHFRMFSHDPRLHFPIEDTQRDLDVCFMGRDVPARRPLVEALREWGAQTDRRVHIETDYARGRESEVYRRSKIVLNWSQRDELNMRAFESAACGALGVLQHDALPEIRAAGAPIPTYHPHQMERMLEAWLADPAELARWAAKQQKWVQTEAPARHLEWLCRQIKERIGNGRRGDRAARGGGLVGGGGPVGVVEAPPRLEVAPVGEPSPSERRTQCVDLLPTSLRKVLDIGCGVGGVGWELRRRSPDTEVTGLDADERVADLAKSRLTRFIQAGIEVGEDHPLWATLREFGPYDAILCLDVLEHLCDPWATLKRLRPLLVPDGVLLASVPNLRNASTLNELIVNGDFRYFRHGRMDFRGPSDNVLSWEHLRFFTRRTAVELLRETGYAVERCEPTPFLMPGEVAARWRADLATLVRVHGGLPERLEEELLVIQWLLLCRPEWQAAV